MIFKKKRWLDYLFYKIGKQQYDFRLNSLKKISDGNVISSKWKKFSEIVFPVDINEEWKLKYINNREILPCEIVIDLENRRNKKWVLKKIKEDGFPYYVFDTHSRGFHIHIFYDNELTEQEKIFLIKRYHGDIMKAHKGSTIALEYTEHYKSGKIKELIEHGN